MDKYKVVIVDDDEVALKKLSIELRKNPYFSLDGTARNGKQGEKLITKIQPDLLFGCGNAGYDWFGFAT